MKICAVYFSPTRSTERITLKISETLSSLLGVKTAPRELTFPSQRSHRISVGEEDLLVLGLPVYGGRIPELAEHTLDSLKGRGNPALIVALYGNREYDDTLLEMKNLLTGKKFSVLAAGAFIGEHSLSRKVAAKRPDSRDLEAAEGFAREAVRVFEEWKEDARALELTVKGTFPYKERFRRGAVAPVTLGECRECMQCVCACPVGAVSVDNPRIADSRLCICCGACIKICPMGSKEFADGEILKMKSLLEKNCAGRREPEIFLGTFGGRASKI